MNTSSINMLREGLSSCINEALRNDMHVSLTAHVDDSSASSVAKWRNRLLLDPYEQFGGKHAHQLKNVHHRCDW